MVRGSGWGASLGGQSRALWEVTGRGPLRWDVGVLRVRWGGAGGNEQGPAWQGRQEWVNGSGQGAQLAAQS